MLDPCNTPKSYVASSLRFLFFSRFFLERLLYLCCPLQVLHMKVSLPEQFSNNFVKRPHDCVSY